jgi:hypothetical protein
MKAIRTAFWNLGNLFDTKASDLATDLDFTPANQWTEAAFDAKVKNLAAVLNALHDGQGADLIGLCEIENLACIRALIRAMGRDDLQIAHIESEDIRGIDVTLLYSEKIFRKPVKADLRGHVVHLRYPTRDIFEVRLRLKAPSTAELIVLVNHWPSRRQSQYESEPLRITAAEHAGRLVDAYLKFSKKEWQQAKPPLTLAQLRQRWNRNVLLMGDFNDEPFNRSILDYLQASKDLDHLEDELRGAAGGQPPRLDDYLGRSAWLFNAMWPLMSQPETGSYFWSSATNTKSMLDQFILSRGLLHGLQGLRFIRESVGIHSAAPAADARGRPVNFDREKLTGCSDHLPITAVLEVL